MYFYEQNRSNENNYLYFQFDRDFNFPLHLHKSFEFIYVENGDIEIQVGNKNFSLQKNKAALIFPGQLHSYSTQKHSEIFLCIFSADFIYDFYNFTKGKVAENPTFDFIPNNCIEQLINNNKNSFTVKSALYNIAGQFLNSCTLISSSDDDLELLSTLLTMFRKILINKYL